MPQDEYTFDKKIHIFTASLLCLIKFLFVHVKKYIVLFFVDLLLMIKLWNKKYRPDINFYILHLNFYLTVYYVAVKYFFTIDCLFLFSIFIYFFNGDWMNFWIQNIASYFC
jgi:hypothetical protein